MNACNSLWVFINIILCSLRFCTVWYCFFYFVSLYRNQTQSVLNSSATVRGPIDRFDSNTIRVLTRPPKLYVFSRSSVQSMLAAFARDIGIIRSWVGKHTHTHTHTYIDHVKIVFEILKLLKALNREYWFSLTFR